MERMSKQQADEIKRRHRDSLLKIAGVQGVGVEEDESGAHRLVVLTDDTVDRSRLPSEIEGLPVSIECSGRFHV
jgi:hypothetical protein